MSELYSYSKNKMKMLVSTDYKKFDKQTNLITYGNVLSGTQHSNYIRSTNEVESYGNKLQAGELRNYDLKYFTKYFDNNMKEFFNQFFSSCCLYEFSVYNKDQNQKDVIGWLVYDNEHNHLLKYHVNNNFKYQQKGKSVLDLVHQIIFEAANKVKNLKGEI